ncbi:unnamed protein product [Soboliphyme baturini]|uniref:Rbsn domain-containing protein n=1 Tax=Soboliphyme baturini TaxID=241478 RepID=A0A183J4A0_9BILA|nr:unnamed protein product [Soboliphyme baturini]
MNSEPPIMVQMYENMRSLMAEVSKLVPSFHRMCESLWAGQSLYNLENAQSLRAKLSSFLQHIEFVSDKIAKLDVPNDENFPRVSTAVLQRNIRSHVMHFIESATQQMPSLPSQSEYLERRDRARQLLHDQLEKERSEVRVWNDKNPAATVDNGEERLVSYLDSPGESGTFDRRESEGLLHGFSATGDHSNLFIDNDVVDPLQEQTLLLKDYIRQATLEGRLDVAECLESNLKELLQEIEMQQRSS